MIRRLAGVVVDMGLNFVVIDVAGVGYQIFVPRPTDYPLDQPALLHTHQAVRENALDLYGFPDRDALEVFELLIELPKIGPKSALQFMTQADAELIKEAVLNNDPGYLSKVSGISKKSAEKIVAGLQDTFETSTAVGFNDRRALGSAAHTSDTIDALIALGYPALDARRIVIDITTSEPELISSADIIKIALRRLHT